MGQIGPSRVRIPPPKGESFSLIGEFREVDPPTRLAYTFVWDPPDPDDVETVVDLRLRDVDGSTEAAFSQGPFKTEAEGSARGVLVTG